MGTLAAIFGFITSPFGKIISYIVAGFLAFGALTVMYLTWEHKVQEAEKLKYENVQLHQTVTEQQNTIKNQTKIIQIQDDETKKLNQQIDDIVTNTSSIDQKIDEAPDDRPSLPVLKDTYKQLFGDK